MPNPDPVNCALFVESFNLDLVALSSGARVKLSTEGSRDGQLELRDDEGNFICLIPSDTRPEMAAIAYRLYGQGLNRGVRAGEEAAWAKLRYLIGAAVIAGAD